MSFFIIIIYNIILVPLWLVTKIAGLFNAKIRATLQGRLGLFEQLERQIQQIPDNAQRLWIHASSMGEYEQAVPLVKELLKRNPEAWIMFTLFSPSGLKHVKETIPRTVLSYLPFDLLRNVNRFLDLVQPSVHVLIRHDVWPNYQWGLQKRAIPSILVDASISDKRLKGTKQFRSLFRAVYKSFTAVCAVSNEQAERLHLIFPRAEQIHVCGDTRYDRVRDRAMDTSKIEHVIKTGLFKKERCLVVGSSWPEDEAVIFPAIAKALREFKDFTLIVAPHELTPEHLRSIEKFISSQGVDLVHWTRFEREIKNSSRVLLVDTIGVLANLYALGSIAFVGGAFGMGVHSVLEPAAHGLWISFGPKHTNSHEATDMAASVSVAISSAEEFESFLMKALSNPVKTAEQGKMTLNTISDNFGASSKTADIIEKYIK